MAYSDKELARQLLVRAQKLVDALEQTPDDAQAIDVLCRAIEDRAWLLKREHRGRGTGTVNFGG